MKYENIEEKNGQIVRESCNFEMADESAKKRFESDFDKVQQARRGGELRNYHYDLIDRQNEYYRAFVAEYKDGSKWTVVIYE